MRKIDLISGFYLFFLTVITYILTIHPLTRDYNIYFLLIAAVVCVGLYITDKKDSQAFVYTSILLVLIIVGITGWFGSPLFSWLYVLAIALAFIFAPFVANVFVLILVLLFLPSLRSFDLNFELLTITSLLLIIPIAEYLRDKYLSLKEKEKDILVLKEENKQYESKLNEVLSNKISRESIDLKEPINDIKQIILYYKTTKNPVKKVDLDKIIDLSNKSLKVINDFEEESTGEKLASTK